MGDNLFRLPEDEYNYLRQLFKFNGIPRYVMLDRDGNVVDDNFPGHNAEYEIQHYSQIKSNHLKRVHPL